jgi:hypothetical protein
MNRGRVLFYEARGRRGVALSLQISVVRLSKQNKSITLVPVHIILVPVPRL